MSNHSAALALTLSIGCAANAMLEELTSVACSDTDLVETIVSTVDVGLTGALIWLIGCGPHAEWSDIVTSDVASCSICSSDILKDTVTSVLSTCCETSHCPSCS